MEYRAVELCEQIASEKVIELAIKYAQRINRVALSKKLESIADTKEKEKEKGEENKDTNTDIKSDDEFLNNDIEEPTLSLIIQKKPDLEIKPLSMADALSMKRNNPFLKSGNSPAIKGIVIIFDLFHLSLICKSFQLNFIFNKTGLAGLDITPEKPQKLITSIPVHPKSKSKESKDTSKKETFVSWYAKNKKSLQEKFPELNSTDLTKTALARYKEIYAVSQSNDSLESKKRKLSSENEQNNEPKRVSNVLSSFVYKK